MVTLKVTDKQIEEMQIKVENWGGSNYTASDYTELIAELLTGAYSLKELKDDVLSYE